MEKQTLRFGAGAIAFALLMRLLSGNVGAAWNGVTDQTGWIQLLLFLGTGQVIHLERPTAPTEQAQTPQTQPPQTESTPGITAPSPSEPEKLGVADLEIPKLNNQTGYQPELEDLLRKPLSWDLTGEAPTVLIVHTHATESYMPLAEESYEESGAWRSLDERYNMVAVGDELARLLEAGGIRVLHDRTFHDKPSYNSAYSNARKAIDSYLAQYPSIRMVLDIHRDAAQTSYGQLVTSATVGGQKSAQLMMVVGTDAGGNHHPQWQENLALALKLSAVLEQTDPGITRPVNLRTERFNMDKTAGSLLVEVGAAGNTQQEALIAVHALAAGILTLAHGTQ